MKNLKETSISKQECQTQSSSSEESTERNMHVMRMVWVKLYEAPLVHIVESKPIVQI